MAPTYPRHHSAISLGTPRTTRTTTACKPERSPPTPTGRLRALWTRRRAMIACGKKRRTKNLGRRRWSQQAYPHRGSRATIPFVRRVLRRSGHCPRNVLVAILNCPKAPSEHTVASEIHRCGGCVLDSPLAQTRSLDDVAEVVCVQLLPQCARDAVGERARQLPQHE